MVLIQEGLITSPRRNCVWGAIRDEGKRKEVGQIIQLFSYGTLLERKWPLKLCHSYLFNTVTQNSIKRVADEYIQIKCFYFIIEFSSLSIITHYDFIMTAFSPDCINSCLVCRRKNDLCWWIPWDSCCAADMCRHYLLASQKNRSSVSRNNQWVLIISKWHLICWSILCIEPKRSFTLNIHLLWLQI